MQSLFEEPTPESVSDQGSDSVDTVSPDCGGAMDKVSVCLYCVCKCL